MGLIARGVLLGLAGLAASVGVGAGRPPHLFLVGDSTMAPKPPPPGNPEHGWGEALPFFFDENIVIDNRALNGRSTLSFRSEGHWQKLLDDLRAGDWVLIQFGHNDEKSNDPSRYAAADTDFRANLDRFVEEVWLRGAHTILATPIVRREFDDDGNLVPTHGDYPEVVREVAEANNVPLLDLRAETWDLVQELGEEDSKKLFVWVPEGRYARFPNGNQDNTHLSTYGASVVAEMAANAILRLDLSLAERLKKPMPQFQNVEWEVLYPEDSDGSSTAVAEGYTEEERINGVSHPAFGVFPSAIAEAPRPAVVVCPGGGYGHLAMEHEGYDIARWLNSLGIDAYVLKYRLKESGYPAPLQDVTRTIRILRSTAEARGIDAGRIGVLGFSAGGHVAGMATTLWDSADSRLRDPLDGISARPDFSVMIYPVVTMKDPFAHAGSRTNLLGEDADRASIEALSLETRVTAECPPVFLAHSVEDEAVPAENSLHFAEALLAHDVSVALHLFSTGPHGFGMRPDNGTASAWPRLLVAWLREQGVLSVEEP